ncbi:hypothetical protein ACFZDG_21150 [Kitasatospora xanthocidica]|uniref:hypothetical protein n=1 Tax=Kitasatospora xanthocidica TaxID=83382 RepID=UPI0036E21D19
MTNDQVSRLIGGSFGLAFVQMNAGTLPTAAAAPLRVLAILAFLRIVLTRRRAAETVAGDARPARGPGFGKGYWYVVAAEVLGLGVGLYVIANVLDKPDASVAWIAFVVGVHFFGLAVVWKRAALHVLAASMAVCGVAGLVLAVCDVSKPVIAVVSGIVPGVLLLGSVLLAGRTTENR